MWERLPHTKYIKIHELFHSGVKKYICDQCGSSFTTAREFKEKAISESTQERHHTSADTVTKASHNQVIVTNMNVHTWKWTSAVTSVTRASGMSVHTPNTNDPTLYWYTVISPTRRNFMLRLPTYCTQWRRHLTLSTIHTLHKHHMGKTGQMGITWKSTTRGKIRRKK